MCIYTIFGDFALFTDATAFIFSDKNRDVYMFRQQFNAFQNNLAYFSNIKSTLISFIFF